MNTRHLLAFVSLTTLAAATGCGGSTEDVTPMGKPLRGFLETQDVGGSIYFLFLGDREARAPCPVLNADMIMDGLRIEGPFGAYDPAQFNGTLLPSGGCRPVSFDGAFLFDSEPRDVSFSIVGPDIDASYTGVNLMAQRRVVALDELVVSAGAVVRLRHEPTSDIVLADGGTSSRFQPMAVTAVRIDPSTGEDTDESATIVPGVVDGVVQLALPTDMVAGLWNMHLEYAYQVPAASCVGFSSCDTFGIQALTTTIEVR